MNDYGNIKTGQLKNDPISLAMPTVPVYPSRPMSGTVNHFQNPSTFGFNMESSIGHTPNIYNPVSSHLLNSTKMNSLQQDIETRHIGHHIVPSQMLYHNFSSLNSCTILTTNGFYNLNTPEMSKHSFEDVMNIPTNRSNDSSLSTQIMLPKLQNRGAASSVTTDDRHYLEEPVHSYAHDKNHIEHNLTTDIRKQAKDLKIHPKSENDSCLSVDNTIHSSPVEDNNSHLSNDHRTEDVSNNRIQDELVPSTDKHDRDIYKCGFCELKLFNNEALLSHLKTHTSSLPYQCGFCGTAFIEISHLADHVQKLHKWKAPYACGLCASTFYANEVYLEHIEFHKANDKIAKTKLPPISTVREKLKAAEKLESMKHEETELEEDEDDEDIDENYDNSTLPVNCEANTIVIGKDTNFSLRKGPSKIVTDDIDISSVCTVIIEPSSAGGIRKKHLFKCNYCEKVCKDKGSLVSHVRTHTKGRPYECSICTAKFKQYAHLSDHIMTKHTKERPFVCDRCAKTFNRKSHLQDHIRLRHTDDKLYHCTECNSTFQKRTEFSDHKRTHGKPPKYQCSMCPRQFRNVTDYERHIRSHTKEKRFECEICHLTFGLLANAKKHMIKHNEERPFKCEICPKAYHFEHDFKRHKLTHLKKKPFPCSDCYKSFKNALLLKKHAKETHMKTEEDSSKKPFKCFTCRKRFRIQWDLDRHRKIHAKKKPFPCLYCYKSYGSEAMLTKHSKVHEGQNLPLYDHTKDLMDEPEIVLKQMRCGRKKRLDSESKTQTDDSEVSEKPKQRGRPPKQKFEPSRTKNGMLKHQAQSLVQSNDSETDEKSAPRIKVTLRRRKLRKRNKFYCTECKEVFVNKTMLDKHARFHENDDETEADSHSMYQSESTNETVKVAMSFNENANDATSLKRSPNNVSYDLVNNTAHIDRTRGEDTTQDGDITCDYSSTSELDSVLEFTQFNSKAIDMQKRDTVSYFSEISNHKNSLNN